MPTKSKWQAAEHIFKHGLSLYRENRFDQALIELRRAADSFRRLDARGSVFSRCLPNGVTGHANALALSAQCHYRLGEIEQAVSCFEATSINEQFERPAPFHAFQNEIRPHLISCYERIMQMRDPAALSPQMEQAVKIDISLRFPFSLPRDLIPPARLYELEPGRYGHYAGFYHRTREQDSELRRADKRLDSDGVRMHRTTASIWTILGVLWFLYTIFAFKALFPNAVRAVITP